MAVFNTCRVCICRNYLSRIYLLGNPANSSLRVVLEIIRLLDYRLDIEDRCSVDGFDGTNQQAIGIFF